MEVRGGKLILHLLNPLAEAYRAEELPSADGSEAAELEVKVRLAGSQQQSAGIRGAGPMVPQSTGELIAQQLRQRR